MTEHNPHLEYQSVNVGAAHMCGHDGYMTSLVGFGILMQQAHHLLPPHTCVRSVFQPAEEGGFGAVEMIKGGCLDGVDEIYGYHNGPFPLVRFSILLQGPGGHGSAPHKPKIPFRNVSAQESAVISITQVHGGKADNVIPSQVKLSGTIRDMNPDVFSVIEVRLNRIVEHTAAAFGVNGTLNIVDGYPVTKS
ncbi:amidohydrolase family protein [Thraustotheca clavata]|uniref:Amidohydrolase family protein n=1 Tax=Thraustotheca clavata TaxID=74557 RepID=A0A1V9ZYI4_9STRA|nr:amidohydrolase family protein [Thraustotheca clavata]